MARAVSTSWAFVFAVLAGVALAPGHAAEVSAAKKGSEEQSATALGLPAEVATKHVITLAGEKLAFTARAGAVRLSDAQSGAPRADVAFVSYERADARSADAARRFRLQRRTRRGLRVAGARRAVALAASPRWRQLFAIDAAARRRQRRKLARLRRSRVRRSSRHGIQQVFERERKVEKAFFLGAGRRRRARRGRAQMADDAPAIGFAEISGWRELWRLSRRQARGRVARARERRRRGAGSRLARARFLLAGGRSKSSDLRRLSSQFRGDLSRRQGSTRCRRRGGLRRRGICDRSPEGREGRRRPGAFARECRSLHGSPSRKSGASRRAYRRQDIHPRTSRGVGTGA